MMERSVLTRFSVLQTKAWTMALALTFCGPVMHGAVAQAATNLAVQEYKVGAGDVLSITVYGDAGLTGQFPVSADGTIGYPILGTVDVLDKTAPDIAELLRVSLVEHIANLSVAVAVTEYAPVFVIGDVRNSGRYQFRPGMIALELFALSGGLREATDKTMSSELQLMVMRQEYVDGNLQVLAQDVKRARLEAELNDGPFVYDLNGQADPATADEIVQAERRLYELSVAQMETEKRSLIRQKANFAEEIKTLEQSTALRATELKLVTEQADASASLVSKGLVVKAELRDQQRQVSAANRDLLEAGAYLARARQNESEIDQRILSLVLNRHSLAAKDLREVNIDLVRLRRRMAFNLEAISRMSSAARRASLGEIKAAPVFTVVRPVNGAYQESVLQETDPVRGGDILRITVPQVSDMVIGSLQHTD
ncbi:polysaccharide biosynthesis/export family protein [Rhizobium sp. Root482]|uniref:polysaccharide biosynthesis/export family protein n=1 Tax=Rhizobium sp. Root482 TaxID=1736543 RepID=UPI0006F78E1B|nr:polysaccharide biosynthesis/export family protein [Rhizobium sp. Root482]KQY26671.1 hypothetical protein ASD31_00200 [Rhizobium sp. Root482]